MGKESWKGELGEERGWKLEKRIWKGIDMMVSVND